MSEEVKIKISQPMFEVGELERFDNNIHSIVEEYSKLLFKGKDQILTQRIIMKQEEENKQLKDQLQQKENIIKEVREYIKKYRTMVDGYEDEKTGQMIYEHRLKLNKHQVRKLLEILDRSEINGNNK